MTNANPLPIAAQSCHAALLASRTPLVRARHGWQLGRRGFSYHTVRHLIAAGLAFRRGDCVVPLAAPANDNNLVAAE